jgi:hypothetical protein
MNYLIIVARYNENIKWTKEFSNVIIYNKGKKLEEDHEKHEDYNEIFLPNIGREGHTYYQHIYYNYNKLPDYLIFLQGNPFDHSPNLIINLNQYIDKINNNTMFTNFIFLSENIYDCNLINCKFHDNLPLMTTYNKIFDKPVDNLQFKFGAGAQFIVSKKQILKKPKTFYYKIIKLLNYDINPIEGYVIERFHKLIFE